MLTKIIIWGSLQKESKSFTTCHGDKEKCYAQVENKLVQYIRVSSKKELAEQVNKSHDLTICTSYIEEADFIREVTGKSRRCTLLFIPQMKKLEIRTILTAVQRIRKDMKLNQESIKQRQIVLLGSSNAFGEILLEILKHLHLFYQMEHYEFYLKAGKGSIMTYLAEAEDLLKEYVEEGSSLHIAALEDNDNFITTEDFFYLLRANN